MMQIEQYLSGHKKRTRSKNMSLKLNNYIGQRFGKLVIINILAGVGCTKALCKCDCGTEKEIIMGNILSGKSRSCGCVHKTHGLTNTSTYKIWAKMKNRCSSEKTKSYKNYGGRGIFVCERWDKFENFLEDMGERPPSLELDRINNDGPYSPDNCRWTTRKENGRNRRTNRFLTFNGETKTIAEWAESLSMKRLTLMSRLHKGWSVDRALTEPVAFRSERHKNEYI